ncbi:MAG: MFS transporter, partial [SAR324 cluster bacterium]|nr:MFS transporter [SAR324 cluster bacterium]
LARAVLITIFVTLPISNVSVLIFAAVIGFLWLGTVPLTSALVGQIFGVQYLSTLFGFTFLSHQMGSFLGAWLGGYLYDLTGSYNTVWYISVVLGLLAALLHLPINDAQVERLRVAGQPA